MLRRDALARYSVQKHRLSLYLRDMGGKRRDETWSRASDSAPQRGVLLLFAFVCF